MLAAAGPVPRDLSAYLIEPKWDGVRLVVTVDDGGARMVTRNGREVASHYPELAGVVAALGGHAAVLDAEVVAFDDRGATSFQRLQQRMHVAAPPPDLVAAVPVHAMVFDLLWLDGELLTGLPLRDRRARLAEVAPDDPFWHLTPVLPAAPVDELLRAGAEIGMEGYVIKRADAPYHPGRRSSAWIKLKCIRRQEFVVGGWVPGRAGRTGSVGSLATGLYDHDPGTGPGPGRLRFTGLAGSGLTDDWIRQLAGVTDRLQTDESPFAERLVGVRFLAPRLVVEVAYADVTDGGTLRHPRIEGFRTDLDPAAVVADRVFQHAFDRRPPGLTIRV